MKKIKIEWIEWLGLALVCCIFYLVAFFAISALFSNDRWAAFGTVGTWVTGSIAGGIAVAQFIDLRSRRRNLALRSHSSINQKLFVISDALSFATYTITISLTESFQLDLESKINTIKPALRGIQNVFLDPIEKEHLPISIDSELNILNDYLDDVRHWLSLYCKKEHFQRLHTEEGISMFSEKVHKVLMVISQISTESAYFNSLRIWLAHLDEELKIRHSNN